jgi:hypothetical protein
MRAAAGRRIASSLPPLSPASVAGRRRCKLYSVTVLVASWKWLAGAVGSCQPLPREV